MEFRTLFLQELARHGVLMSYISPSYSHGPEEVEKTLDAAERAFDVYARALTDGWEHYVEGPVLKPVFRSHN